MKETVSSAMEANKQYAASKLSEMQSAYEQHGGGIKGAMAAAMTGIRSVAQDGFNFVDNLTGGKLSAIRDPACQIVKEGESCGVKSLYSFYRCCSDPPDAAAVFLVGPFHVAELFFYGRLGCAHHLADDIADCPEYLLCDLEGGTEFFFDPAENAVHQVSEPLAFVVKKDDACNQSNNADHDPGDRIGQQRRRKAPDRVGGFIAKGAEWIQNHQELVRVIMLVVLALGGFLTVAGTVIAVVGGVGLVFTKTAGLGWNFSGSVSLIALAMSVVTPIPSPIAPYKETMLSWRSPVLLYKRSISATASASPKAFCSSIFSAASIVSPNLPRSSSSISGMESS